MKIILNQPFSFSEIGMKECQEDKVYPAVGKATTASRYFLVCDGLGGYDAGDRAATLVTEAFARYFRNNPPEDGRVDEAYFTRGLRAAYKALNVLEYSDPKRRPGTTLTCLYLGSNGVLVAHIGDTRIYQVRPGRGIVFKTEDHSVVNEMLKRGEITEAEARVHPRRNVITRAMQTGLERPFRADVKLLTDVRAGDYFFMCTDGVREQVNDTQLVDALSDSTINDEEKIEAITSMCEGITRDNYSAYLIPIAKVMKSNVNVSMPQGVITDEVKEELNDSIDDEVPPFGRWIERNLRPLLAWLIGGIAVLSIYSTFLRPSTPVKDITYPEEVAKPEEVIYNKDVVEETPTRVEEEVTDSIVGETEAVDATPTDEAIPVDDSEPIDEPEAVSDFD